MNIKHLTLAKQAAEIEFQRKAVQLADAGNPAESDDAVTALDEWAAALEALTAATVALQAAIDGQTAEPPREETPPADKPDETEPTKSQKGSRTMKQLNGSKRQYSLSKFLMACADTAHQKSAGYELECSQEIAHQTGKSGYFIPFDAFIKKSQDTITGPDGNGTDIGQSLAPQLFQEGELTLAGAAAFKPSGIGQLGVGIVQAELGPFSVPRMVEPLAPKFVARDAAVPDVTGRFDSLSMVPHTLGGLCEIKRSALIDTRPAMEDVIKNAIWAATLNAIDDAFLGVDLSVNANRPAGLYTLLLASATDSGQNTPAELLQALADIADVGNGEQLAYIASNGWGAYAGITAVSAALSQSSLSANMPSNFARVLNGRMTALDAQGGAGGAGNRNHHLMFGPFASMSHVALFGGGLMVDVNAHSQQVYASGGLLVRSMVDVDFLVRDVSRFGLCYNSSVPA